MTMPWIALVCDISGVCRVVGTFEITSKPTKTASTKIVISVKSVIQIPPASLPHEESDMDVRSLPRSFGGPLVADLAAVGDAGGGDDVILEVDLQPTLLVDEEPEQVLEVLGVELRGGDRHLAGQIARADHLDAALLDRLAGLGQLAVAAGLGGEVDDHRARFHAPHRRGGDQDRR